MVKVLEVKENSNNSCSNDLAVVFRSHNRDIQGFITSNGIVTDEIDAIYAKISASHPEYLHPNLSRVTLRPWGAKEFALRDHQVCIIFQQW